MSLTRETLRIVLVENDEDDLFFVKRAVLQAGFSHPMIHLFNGRAAVNYLESIKETELVPDILLMDLKMPEMDGFDVLRWLRQQPRFKDLPVVMLTSSDDPGDIRQTTRLGIYKFLTKEVQYDNVVSTLKLFLHSHGSASANPGVKK